jgi:RNA polymerase sigma factor (sigma-70 family)
MADGPFNSRAVFATTRWSMVLAAGQGGDTQSASALEELCRAYWRPLYAFVRRQGRDPEEARDLTQEFFARLLSRDDLARVAPEKGRFRTFLLTALSHFLANEWNRTHRQKRGGGQAPLSIEGDAEEWLAREPAHHDTPERAYERRWALTLLEQALARLRAECRENGRGAVFEALQGTLDGSRVDEGLVALGERIGLSEGAVKTALHRLRRRYGELLREAVAQTVVRPEDVEDELRHLLTALRS